MRLRAPIILCVTLALGLAAEVALPSHTAAAPDHRGPSCFWARDVDNFVSVDERTVNLRVGVHDVYQLKLFNSCPDIDWHEHIALQSGVSSQICEGPNLDVTIVSPSSIGPQRCPVTSVRRLSPAEVAALPKKQRP